MTEREQTERALLGCVLENPDLAHELNPEWFDDLRLAQFLIIATSLHSAGQPVDATTICHKSGDEMAIVLLRECQEQCPSAANAPYWREILGEMAEKDRLKKAAGKFLAALPESNGDLAAYVAELENALAAKYVSQSPTLTRKEIAHRLNEHLEQRMNLQGALSGLATGFSDLDRLLDGFQFGELTLLASRPSIGKTAIACNLVEKICLIGKIPTLFLSLEMSAAALSRRLLSAYARIPMKTLKAGTFSGDDFKKIAAFHSLIVTSPIFIREAFGGMGATEAAALIRRGARRKQIKFVVLDYLQKLRPDKKHEKRTYEVAEASGAMMAAVKDSGVAMLCLAQLNRENEKDKGRRPRLSDLADSGQIERDADNVLLLHRDRGDMSKPAELIIAKQRDGETGMVKLSFDGGHCRFNSYTNQQPE